MKFWNRVLDFVGNRRCRCAEPQWRVTIEHYPTFAWDKWCCRRCGQSEDFPNNEPPVPIQTEICSLGHVHIVNTGREEVEDILNAELVY